MALPAPGGPLALLPAYIYPASLAEIEEMFVTRAPHVDERRAIFDAFRSWMEGFDSLFPGTTIWLDGGFVTHKDWAAPHDVDVAVHASGPVMARWNPALVPVFRSYFTDRDAGTQPMGGLVDAFFFASDNPAARQYWRNQWGKVRGRDRNTALGVQKGFVEVIR
ncbi:hypothetical protein RN607_05475 [Demequina capsici]|uniref:Uncharacterized protein n=1 Tax=Demequina capsici TaxID=3075620 RepID=A0AA96JAJ2_9MICO|nr:hypothetical protein [Demequina sp. PMTSA13]WNM28452.1 hypothetical protein RN607_05475 [Demequina sp. PMTSA13]